MEINARKFTSEGVEQLRNLFAIARFGLKSTQAANLDENLLGEITNLLFQDEITERIENIHLNDQQSFKSRLELGRYLHEKIPSNSTIDQYNNVGFWTWISALYLTQLLEPNKDGKSFKLWSNYRYIPEAQLSKLRYYRHLCFLPYWICKTQPQATAEFFLINKPYVHSDAIEQLYTADKDFLPFPGIIEVAKRLYINPQSNTYRKNYLGKSTAGSARRLATVIVKQWQLNYDLQVLTADQIWEILPKEFNNWKKLAGISS